MSEIYLTIQNMRAIDYADIFIVGLGFYAMFVLLRRSRSQVALRGFVTLTVVSLFVFLLARVWRLQAMALIFENSWIIVALVFLIVFQNEFKKALTDLGQMRIFRSFFPRRESDALDHVIQAVKVMSRDRVGALIAFERRNPLSSYTERGTILDAGVSADLIRTVFTPLAPLHDGALIVSGERLLAGACILPLTQNTELSRELGTRHRAAIGLTEETDAAVVVVSEETGIVSLALDGKITRHLKAEELQRTLEKLLDVHGEENEEAAAGDAA